MSVRRTRAALRIVSPLQTWFPDGAALLRFRRRSLARRAVVLQACDDAWRSIAPDFRVAVDMAASGLPFHIAAERRYDREANVRRLRPALASGATVYLPQVHQVLPRLARLMVALRAALFGPLRDESSFLFLVEGRGRPGMGLHHDGEVDSVWLQLEGRRTVTLGPVVEAGTPADLEHAGAGPGWWTRALEPGTLLYMPPRTPHEVVCHERSLAVSLTWDLLRRRARPGTRAWIDGLVHWDVAGGHVVERPASIAGRLWTQVPAAAGPLDRRGWFRLWTADGAVRLRAPARRLARRLAEMPALIGEAPTSVARALAPLIEHGVLADEELPLRIVPEDPGRLDGWRFV